MSTESTTGLDKAVQTQRVVTLFSTRGNKKEKITTDVTTWGELKSLVSKAGFSVGDLHCTENVNKTDLVHEEAKLPETDFVLFMRPKETKSGADMSRADLFTAIKAFVGTDKDRKQLFIIDGKNMTQLSTPVLQELYNQHIAGNSASPASTATPKAKEPKATKASTTKKAAKDTSANVADVVNSVAEAKQGEPINNSYRLGVIAAMLDAISSCTDSEDVKDAVAIVNKKMVLVAEAVAEDTQEHTPTEFVGEATTSSDTSAVDEAKRQLKEEEDEAARKAEEERLAKEKAEREENEMLAKEAEELARGFKRR